MFFKTLPCNLVFPIYLLFSLSPLGPPSALASDKLREIKLFNLKLTPQSRITMGLLKEGQTAATISVFFLSRISEVMS